MVDDKFLLKSHSTVPHAIEKLGSGGLDWGRYSDVISRLIIPPKVFNGHGDQVQTQSRIPRPPNLTSLSKTAVSALLLYSKTW